MPQAKLFTCLQKLSLEGGGGLLGQTAYSTANKQGQFQMGGLPPPHPTTQSSDSNPETLDY